MTAGSTTGANPISLHSIGATFRDGVVQFDRPVDWNDGTRLLVTPAVPIEGRRTDSGHVTIVGYGLAGRCVSDLLDQANVRYTILERNPVTVETQKALGRDIIEGNATDAETLQRAGLAKAAILALTIPDEEAVLQATALARRLQPEIYIIARTQYASKGMKAAQLGADDVIKAEQAVALQFYDKLSQRILR